MINSSNCLLKILLCISLFGCSKSDPNSDSNAGGPRNYLLDPTFISPSLSFGLSAGAVQANNKVVAGGPGGLVRFNTDGTIDPSFKPPAEISAGGQIYSIVVQSDWKILVAGDFKTGSHVNLVRLNTDGSVDNSFQLEGIITARPKIYSILLETDGSIIISGTFDYSRDSKMASGIARISGIGKLSRSFISPKYSSTLRVSESLVLPSRKILVAGDFSIGTGSDSRSKIVRLNIDGSPDLSFNYVTRPWTLHIPDIPGSVTTLSLDNSSRLLVGGDFTRKNGDIDGSLGTEPCNGILMLNENGSETATFKSPDRGSGTVNTILPMGRDRLLVGRTSPINYPETRDYFTLLDADGNADDFELEEFVSGNANVLLRGADSTVYMLGSFYERPTISKNIRGCTR